MASNVVRFRPSGDGLPTGPGSGDDGGMPPALEQKVDTLLADTRDIKASLTAIRESSAELKGKVSQIPTWWQFFLGLLGVAGLVFAIARAMK